MNGTFAIMVLPHPGGPCNSTPLGALVNFEWANKSLSLIGKITVSLSSSITDSRPATDQILYFNFSLKPLRFFLTRNMSDTKISRAKSWETSIIKLTKTPILQNCQLSQNYFCICVSYLQLFRFCLYLHIFVSVYILRENLRGLKEDFKHKIRTYVIPTDLNTWRFH